MCAGQGDLLLTGAHQGTSSGELEANYKPSSVSFLKRMTLVVVIEPFWPVSAFFPDSSVDLPNCSAGIVRRLLCAPGILGGRPAGRRLPSDGRREWQFPGGKAKRAVRERAGARGIVRGDSQGKSPECERLQESFQCADGERRVATCRFHVSILGCLYVSVSLLFGPFPSLPQPSLLRVCVGAEAGPRALSAVALPF